MFTDAPAAAARRARAAVSAADVTWWWPPQSSNQPSQNSAHISGPVGWCRRSAASRSVTCEPNDAVACSSGRLPSASMVARRLVHGGQRHGDADSAQIA